jgi:hypothetical protein
MKILVALALLLVTAVPAQAKPIFAEPEEGPDPRGLTVSGDALARVKAPTRLSERTITRAVDAARPTALTRAIDKAHRRARALAEVAGLTLGPALAVTDRFPDLWDYPNPYRYCNTPRPRRRLRCRAPDFAAASVRITFATAETSAVRPATRAVVASGNGGVLVRPQRKTSASIRAALTRAQLAADPLALRDARHTAAGVARAAALQRGSLLALAEAPSRYFFPNLIAGTYGGPGRFCGIVRRRPGDPGRRRCRVPEMVSELRVTYAASPAG